MSSFSISRPSPRTVPTTSTQPVKTVVKDNIFASDFDEIFDAGKKKEGEATPSDGTTPQVQQAPPVYYNVSYGACMSRPSDKCPDMY